MPVYERLRRELPDPKAMREAGEARLRKLIQSLGLPWRAHSLHRLATELKARHGDVVPRRREALEALPGVGPYASAAFLSLHLGRRAPIVDANVVRLFGRLYGLPTDPESRRRRVFLDLAEALTPRRSVRDFNYALLDLTRTICVPGRPHCDECPLARECRFAQARKNRGQNSRLDPS